MYTQRRIFDSLSQERFAKISGDANPIHLDPIAARRTQAGAPIVHGVHSLVWILECFSQSGLYKAGATGLKAQFLRPIYVGDEVVLELSQAAPGIARARITTGSDELVVATLGFEDTPKTGGPLPETHSSATLPPASPHELSLGQMEGLAGCLSFGPAISQLQSMFPAAVGAFGIDRVSALVSSSCLVGMVVPGLHSMYSGLDVSLAENQATPPGAMQFAVRSVNKRFRSVRIEICARGVRGFLETVSRMPPVSQPSLRSLQPLVSPDEFRDSVSLVVGGSRGLGQLTAKLLAAGGGEVLVTYATGKSDAAAVVEETAQAGAKCSALPYNVRLPAVDQLRSLGAIPTHVYYFATPVIARRKTGFLDLSRLAEFNLFYVTAFLDLLEACLRLRPEGIRAFYPSTTFVEARPNAMTEYAMAKAAAEILCSDLSKYVPGARVLMRRLPRLPTDQTTSVVPVKTADPIEVMLPIVREMHSDAVTP